MLDLKRQIGAFCWKCSHSPQVKARFMLRVWAWLFLMLTGRRLCSDLKLLGSCPAAWPHRCLPCLRGLWAITCRLMHRRSLRSREREPWKPAALQSEETTASILLRNPIMTWCSPHVCFFECSVCQNRSVWSHEWYLWKKGQWLENTHWCCQTWAMLRPCASRCATTFSLWVRRASHQVCSCQMLTVSFGNL